MAGKKAVLVVDDEPSIADALELILSDNGYDVAVCATGGEAINKLCNGRFDLVITDVRLPDISGIEVLRRLRRNNPGVLAIVITTQPTPELAAQLLSLGVVTALAKPFTPSELLTVIVTAFSRR